MIAFSVERIGKANKVKMYLDQNIWQNIIENIEDSKFVEASKKNNISYCVSTTNIYEFAKLFLDEFGNGYSLGKRIFDYYYKLLEIILFIDEPQNLINNDITHALTGGKLFPYLDSVNEGLSKQEIYNLAQGIVSDRLKIFISNRINSMKKHSDNFVSTIKKVNKDNLMPTNFSEMKNNWADRRYLLNNSENHKTTKNISDDILFSEQNKYPYLNTWVNCQLYINYITMKEGGKPNNFNDDMRHLIFANSADYFVTEDSRLSSLTEKCGYVKVCASSKFKEMLTF